MELCDDLGFLAEVGGLEDGAGDCCPRSSESAPPLLPLPSDPASESSSVSGFRTGLKVIAPFHGYHKMHHVEPLLLHDSYTFELP